MRIYLINHYAVPIEYYPLARTYNFAKYLMKMGHDVLIFAASSVHNSTLNLIQDDAPSVEMTADGIPYVLIKTSSYQGNGWGRIINMFQFARRLKRVIYTYPRPDAILASSATPPACVAGLKAARHFACKGIAEISDLWPQSFIDYGLISSRNPFVGSLFLYEKRMYELADRVIFTMEGGADYIKEKGWNVENGGSIEMSKIYHINNGIDLDAFMYNKEHFKIDDADLNDAETFKMGYIGSIRRVNNLSLLVKIAARLKSVDAKVKILIFGDGDERSMLENQVKSAHLTNIVFKGKFDKKYVPYILSKIDLNLVHSTNSTVFKYGVSMNKLFDCLASGKPILSDIKVNYDLVSRYGAGVVVDSQKPEEMVRRILEFKQMPKQEYEVFCQNALETAKKYDFKQMTKDLLQILSN